MTESDDVNDDDEEEEEEVRFNNVSIHESQLHQNGISKFYFGVEMAKKMSYH